MGASQAYGGKEVNVIQLSWDNASAASLADPPGTCTQCATAFDSDSNVSHSTDDHGIDTDGSIESFISLGNFCKLTPLA